MEILTGRPEGMSFEEYKSKLKEQNKLIKNRGQLYYCSSQIKRDPDDQLNNVMVTYSPFIGDTEELIFPI